MSDATHQIVCRSPVRNESDVALARRETRALGQRYGFPASATEALATAVSEIARNVIVHAGTGEVLLAIDRAAGAFAIVVIARDDGPGISDIASAMRDGYSTAFGLGLGLPSARRLVDEFAIESIVDQGTTVTMKKWLTPPEAHAQFDFRIVAESFARPRG
jgi:serine/threonine-protein kinase RsbT